MEKFPKYFLSLIIFVVYSNLQAQQANVIENVNYNSVKLCTCSKICEPKFLGSQFYIKHEQYSNSKNSIHILLEYDKTLQNFEKQNKVLDFAEKIDFRNKVSKTRNKDYLNFDKNI